MQAVIKTGGKQYLVQPDQTLEIDVIGEDIKTLTFEPLLVIDGANVHVGTPTITNMLVTADVIGVVKGVKLDVMKFKAKKRIMTKTGHRQRYTQVKIVSIGATKAAKTSAAAAR